MDGALQEDDMRHPDTIPESTPQAPEPATSRRALLRGLGMASVGAAASVGL